MTPAEVETQGEFIYYLKRYPGLDTGIQIQAGAAYQMPDGREIIVGWQSSRENPLERGLVWEYESGRASGADGWMLD